MSSGLGRGRGRGNGRGRGSNTNQPSNIQSQSPIQSNRNVQNLAQQTSNLNINPTQPLPSSRPAWGSASMVQPSSPAQSQQTAAQFADVLPQSTLTTVNEPIVEVGETLNPELSNEDVEFAKKPKERGDIGPSISLKTNHYMVNLKKKN